MSFENMMSPSKLMAVTPSRPASLARPTPSRPTPSRPTPSTASARTNNDSAARSVPPAPEIPLVQSPAEKEEEELDANAYLEMIQVQEKHIGDMENVKLALTQELDSHKKNIEASEIRYGERSFEHEYALEQLQKAHDEEQQKEELYQQALRGRMGRAEKQLKNVMRDLAKSSQVLLGLQHKQSLFLLTEDQRTKIVDYRDIKMSKIRRTKGLQHEMDLEVKLPDGSLKWSKPKMRELLMEMLKGEYEANKELQLHWDSLTDDDFKRHHIPEQDRKTPTIRAGQAPREVLKGRIIILLNLELQDFDDSDTD